ncbi:hypothetical protein NW765_007179 [Fusarium oxysporum]|nr:hypothetical protein NW765_007179 [Fusarium oxysporum]KAJ4276993.1 hypothetical protein NW764_008235 [Fusarium oxysporum]
MLFTTYRDNRILPVFIIAICLVLNYSLLNSSVERFGTVRLPVNHQPVSATIPIPKPSDRTQQTHPSSQAKLEGSDVLLILKAGGTSMYYRFLIYLATSLSTERINLGNVVICLDCKETIGNSTTIDVLENMTTATKSHPAFDVYHAVPQYVENNV